MFLNQEIDVTGFVTQEKYIKGRSLSEIECILGFHKGRLKNGMTVVALDIPRKDDKGKTKYLGTNEVELKGYSQVASHKFDDKILEDLNVETLKKLVIQKIDLGGVNRLVKVFPVTRHDANMPDDTQYPPGAGAPQWKISVPIKGRVIAIVKLGESYWPQD